LKKLFLITLSFPYDIGQEDTFLKNEVEIYKNIFSQTIFLPNKLSNLKLPLDPSYQIDKDLIDFNLREICYPNLFLYLFKKPLFLINELKNIKLKNFNYSILKKTLSNYLLIMAYCSFFEKYFKFTKNQEITIYTYWFTPITTAACLFSKKRKNIKVITRAHGIDLFEERNNNYFPFRKKTIDYLESIILASEFGKKYLNQKLPNSINKSILSPIGTIDFKINSKKSIHNNFSVVSCSSIDNNKRLNLIIQGLSDFTKRNPHIKTTWNHFGNGPLAEEIINLAEINLTKNIEYKFWGSVPNSQIIKFYENNPVDLFITTSASEGGRPISICEALCCSIPILATEAGGINEVVSNKNGKLLSLNTNYKEISDALTLFLPENLITNEMKKASRNIWEEESNAETINKKFKQFLQTI
jgi:glycosyltransferase involved in cell wall biosynthesis